MSLTMSLPSHLVVEAALVTEKSYRVRDLRTGGRHVLRRCQGPTAAVRQRIQVLGGLAFGAVVAEREILEVDGAAYTLRPWVDGQPLGQAKGERDLLERLVAALQPLHEAGIAHGRIHPGNVIRAATGSLYLVDAGDPVQGLDATGALHAAPEQLRGESPTVRTDVYATGLLLFEAHTGRRPFQGAPFVELARRALYEGADFTFEEASRLEPAVVEAIRRALDRDPVARWTSLRALASELVSQVAAPVAASARPMPRNFPPEPRSSMDEPGRFAPEPHDSMPGPHRPRAAPDSPPHEPHSQPQEPQRILHEPRGPDWFSPPAESIPAPPARDARPQRSLPAPVGRHLPDLSALWRRIPPEALARTAAALAAVGTLATALLLLAADGLEEQVAELIRQDDLDQASALLEGARQDGADAALVEKLEGDLDCARDEPAACLEHYERALELDAELGSNESLVTNAMAAFEEQADRRWLVARVAAKLDGVENELIRYAKDMRYWIRWNAVRALEERGLEEEVPWGVVYGLDVLHAGTCRTRQRSLRRLVQLGDVGARPYLQEAKARADEKFFGDGCLGGDLDDALRRLEAAR